MSAAEEAKVDQLPAAAAAAVDPAVDGGDAGDEDAEMERLRAQVQALEDEQMEEAKRMGALSGTVAPSNPPGSGSGPASKALLSAEQIADQDSRSVHVAQVDYSVTEEELKKLFEACGEVKRATVLKDRFSGQPKGFAYVEFVSADSISNAMILNETEFKGRMLKVRATTNDAPTAA